MVPCQTSTPEGVGCVYGRSIHIDGTRSSPERWLKLECIVRSARNKNAARALEELHMDTTTLLIIVVVLFLLFGGGWYGRGRWY